MSDDLFSWNPGWTTEVSDGFSVRKAQLGDGYVQQAPDGINPSTETWSLVFANLDKDAGYAIRDFLRAHLGQSFLWNKPDGSVQRVRCEAGPRMAFVSGRIASLTCTFIETFNP